MKIRVEGENSKLPYRVSILSDELERAVLSDDSDKIKALLSAAEKRGAISPEGLSSSFHDALERGDQEKVSLLLSYGADPLLPEKQCGGLVYPIHSAALSGNLELLELMILSGGEMEIPDPEGNTPLLLFLRSGKGKLNEIRNLVSKGVNVCARNGTNQNALHLNVVSGQKDPEVLKFLLSKGLDPNAVDNQDSTPLHAAICNIEAEELLIETARALLSYGADVNISNVHRQSVLFEAVKYGRHSLVSFLAEKGADVNEREKTLTPLHVAVREGREEAVNILIAKGADVNVRDRNGKTPLHYAAFFDHQKIMMMLLSEESTLTEAEDFQGRTFLHFIQDSEVKERFALLSSERHRRESLKNIGAQCNMDWDLYDR